MFHRNGNHAIFFKPLTPEPARGTAAETKTCLEISSTISFSDDSEVKLS